MIKFSIKAGLATAAIYYVREQGIWRNSDEAIEASNKIKSAVKPYVDEVKAQIPIEMPKIPETDNICQTAQQYWNLGVRATFSFLVHLPDYSKEYANKGADALLGNQEVANLFNSFTSSESSKPVTKQQ
ncbi:hypothetical protein ABEB36_002680 [Hypothenemus hampei]|uniref:MICOS complex subunit MIC13 n=1 Tax=Hypothenemus hampei TaxID=57062 RepID=A0ABD1F9R2_HYPHA